MMRAVLPAFLAVALAATPVAAKTYQEMFPGKTYEDPAEQKFVESLDYQQGTIDLPLAQTTLTIPEGFYFLSSKDATRVLVDAWKNPASAGEGTLGMIFPAGGTPLDGTTWGAEITYEDEGYVSDDDAEGIDYDDLLATMKTSTAEASKARVEQGFSTMELVGWAAPPFYDKATHKLHWAKELKFGEDPINTLNYNVRVLGRHGVLNINFISGMDQLDQIKSSIPAVMAMAEFKSGARYSDYVAGTDKVAAYGIAGLISGVVLKKVGILGMAFVFLQKFWYLAFAVIAALAAFIRRALGGKPPST